MDREMDFLLHNYTPAEVGYILDKKIDLQKLYNLTKIDLLMKDKIACTNGQYFVNDSDLSLLKEHEKWVYENIKTQGQMNLQAFEESLRKQLEKENYLDPKYKQKKYHLFLSNLWLTIFYGIAYFLIKQFVSIHSAALLILQIFFLLFVLITLLYFLLYLLSFRNKRNFTEKAVSLEHNIKILKQKLSQLEKKDLDQIQKSRYYFSYFLLFHMDSYTSYFLQKFPKYCFLTEDISNKQKI